MCDSGFFPARHRLGTLITAYSLLRSRSRPHWTTCLVSESLSDRAFRVVWLMTIWGGPRPEGLVLWQGEIGQDVTSSTLCFGVVQRVSAAKN